MTRAEDFKKAFGPADPGFEAAVRQTVQELTEREEQHKVLSMRRVWVPVIAAALIMMLGIGIAASNGRWGVFNWLDENRSGEAVHTETPASYETAEPFLSPVETQYGAITVREAQSDGFGIYLSVLFTPKEEGVLALGPNINPFEDGPEAVGIDPDQKGQTLAKWAVSHGYHQLIRVWLHSMPDLKIPEELTTEDEIDEFMDEYGVKSKKTASGAYVLDRVPFGPDFDSYISNKTLLEEDGSTLMMVAGGCVSHQEEYRLTWTAVPYIMNENGTSNTVEPEYSLKDWSQGHIAVPTPAGVSGSPVVLARYAGIMSSPESSEEADPVTVELIRTDLNDYIRIQCPDDQDRRFLAPLLDLESGEPFAHSQIQINSVQEEAGNLVYTKSCQIREDLPDRLIIRWYDSDFNYETVIERTDE